VSVVVEVVEEDWEVSSPPQAAAPVRQNRRPREEMFVICALIAAELWPEAPGGQQQKCERGFARTLAPRQRDARHGKERTCKRQTTDHGHREVQPRSAGPARAGAVEIDCRGGLGRFALRG
jgi:hypothetical protein